MYPIETDWIRRWAQYTPGRLFIREHNTQKEWTYAAAHQVIDNLAAFLADNWTIKKGDRIAALGRNRPEMIFLFFAAMRLGAILVPLNFRLTDSELSIMLDDANPIITFSDDEFAEKLENIKKEKTTLPWEKFGVCTPAISFSDRFESYHRITPDLEDPVMILYTSGTTGTPKGAIINHRMLFWNAVNTSLRLDLTSMDHTQGFAPLFHTGGWNVLFTPFVHNGASHTILDGFDPDLILELMEKEKTTILFGVPTMLQMMAESPLFEKSDLSTVRYAIVGGSPMPIPLIRKWHDKGVWIRQGYGLTEVGPNTFSLHQDDAERKIGSIGFPNLYIDARIVDTDGNDRSDEEIGELWLRSPVVTPGYWQNPKATKDAITDGWFHTGDMMKRDSEGYYYVVDRKKNMYISGGENVYPAEVEKVLNQHPDVETSVVIGIADEKWGETGAAFIVPKKGQAPNSDTIISYCLQHMAKYKTPIKVTFISEIPINDTGKTDRNKLKKMIGF